MLYILCSSREQPRPAEQANTSHRDSTQTSRQHKPNDLGTCQMGCASFLYNYSIYGGGDVHLFMYSRTPREHRMQRTVVNLRARTRACLGTVYVQHAQPSPHPVSSLCVRAFLCEMCFVLLFSLYPFCYIVYANTR